MLPPPVRYAFYAPHDYHLRYAQSFPYSTIIQTSSSLAVLWRAPVLVLADPGGLIPSPFTLLTVFFARSPFNTLSSFQYLDL
jgi:hypothetical protein